MSHNISRTKFHYPTTSKTKASSAELTISAKLASERERSSVSGRAIGQTFLNNGVVLQSSLLLAQCTLACSLTVNAFLRLGSNERRLNYSLRPSVRFVVNRRGTHSTNLAGDTVNSTNLAGDTVNSTNLAGDTVNSTNLAGDTVNLTN